MKFLIQPISLSYSHAYIPSLPPTTIIRINKKHYIQCTLSAQFAVKKPSDGILYIDSVFAELNGLKGYVYVEVSDELKTIDRVFCITTDESVLQKNMEIISSVFIQQCRVVYPNVKIPIRIDGAVVIIQVTDGFGILSEGSEVVVECASKQTQSVVKRLVPLLGLDKGFVWFGEFLCDFVCIRFKGRFVYARAKVFRV